MMFSPLGLVMGAALSQKVKDPQKKSEIELLGGVLGSSPMGIVLLATLAQQAGTTTGTTTGTTASGSDKPTETQVPDVTELVGASVTGALESRGLTLAGTESAISSEPIGTLISSRPVAGSVVALGTAVTVVASGGLQVPDVVNLTLNDATLKLERDFAPMVVRSSEEFEPGPDDVVIKQDPAAHTFHSAGEMVDLTVRAVV
ncbi:MAG: hypothetical protein QOJ56_3926 [Mycobacterium sp.]|nr:hypothetical protein [Mycobacterium sp.]